MHAAELCFRLKPRAKPTEEPTRAIHDFLWSLERNGQLVPDTTRIDVETRNGCRVFALIPESTSLRRSRFDRHVHEVLQRLEDCGIDPPAIRVLGRAPDSDPVCACMRSTSLILRTDFLSGELPLTCGQCRGIVPFYRFDPTSECATYEDIIFWMYQYRAFDSIWIASRGGEKLAYRELTRHDSELTKDGLEVCGAIEKHTRRPVYYYLLRFHGRFVAAERKRPCPSCGGAWLLKRRWHGKYDFRCRRCRLVSNIACEAV
ncbi:MAG: DUF2310 family Zn-ribbon-containing protein [Phycisphaerales bacterium]|nr:DUF2310 family Zn-ribbon-containing protein [Phycisphaerales bacterium]